MSNVVKLYKDQKAVERIYNVVEYDDGMMQILIMDSSGTVFAKTSEFPAHELKGHMNVFFNTELESRELDDTNAFYVIDGGAE